jgi:Ulp1 family protease
MMRKEDRASSPIHIFSSHFYTTLSIEGADAVKSWTARKNIDIFKKRFIFLPVNVEDHWSLCVVVNPANITDGVETGTGPFPCILHLDSLKAHSKATLARHVNKLLNAEWKRLKVPQPQHGDGESLFNSRTMTVFAPRSKFF